MYLSLDLILAYLHEVLDKKTGAKIFLLILESDVF